MTYDIAELAAKMDALNAWDTLVDCNWALKPKGSAMPYFCTALKEGPKSAVKVRVLLLEGWQTFQDFVRFRVDLSFGFYLSPVEFPHFELVVLRKGPTLLYRHDSSFEPRVVTGPAEKLCVRMLWEVYGVMMRLESDSNLPLRYADEKALFARVERTEGEWTDEPLAIPAPRPHIEKVSFSKADLASAKDLPMGTDDVIELDFRLVEGMLTNEPVRRLVYLFAAVEAASGNVIFCDHLVVHPETGLRGLWEGLPPRLLKHLLARKVVPGEIRVMSPRLFRLLRPLGMHLPFKLVKCSELKQWLSAMMKQKPNP